MIFGSGIVLDIVFIGLIILYIFLSYRRGFVRTVVELVGWVLIMYLAFNISQPLAEGIYDRFFFESVSDSIYSTVEGSMGDTAADTTSQLINTLPGFVSSMFGVNEDSLHSTVSQAISGGAHAVSDGIMTAAVSPVIIMLIRWIIVALLFGIGMFVVRMIAGALNSLFSFRLVGGLNRFLGGVIGLFKGVLIVFLICIILSFIITVVPDGFGFLNSDFLKSSNIYEYITGFNLFTFN